MDTDWCLTCSKHIEDPASPYCSLDCRFKAGPSRYDIHPSFQPAFDEEDDEEYYDDEEDAIYHPVNQVSHHYAGIAAWAASVSPGPPCEDIPQRPLSSKSSKASSLRSSRSSHCSPTSVSTVVYRPPELLRPHRPVPATLCMSTPHTVPSSPSRPITTPQQQIAEVSAAAAYSGGTTNTSFESSIATPASSKVLPFSDARKSTNVLDSIASHVRSWVAPSPLAKQQPQFDDEDQPPPVFIHQKSSHLRPYHDELHPSYRTRGRKASRAIA